MSAASQCERKIHSRVFVSSEQEISTGCPSHHDSWLSGKEIEIIQSRCGLNLIKLSI